MKRTNLIIIIVIGVMILFAGFLSGCNNIVYARNTTRGIYNLSDVTNTTGLYYDTITGIVYWWNGCFYSNTSTTPTPYYSPNGLLYRYIPETNTFEEVKPTI